MTLNTSDIKSGDVPLWAPGADRIAASNMESFRVFAQSRAGKALPDYDAMHAWSVSSPDEFWRTIWDYFAPIAEGGNDGPVFHPSEGDHAAEMMAARWFPGIKLNYAENLLSGDADAAAPAIISRREDGQRRELSRTELLEKVTGLARSLKASGVAPGDRVGAVVTNSPEAIIAMLATTAIGAVWSGCAPEFGVPGILERFSQVQPKVLIGVDAYLYKGRTIPVLDHMKDVAAALPGLERVLIIPSAGTSEELPDDDLWQCFDAAVNAGTLDEPFVFERFSFDHPIFIMFSSGTTGLPKCIVHRAGGILLQQMKEVALHYDVKPGDRFFYYTSWAWNMWVWLVTPLALGATVMQFDGMPMHPQADALFDFSEAEGITHFGTSPKYLETLRRDGLVPKDDYRLDGLRAVMSTGSPLSANTFCYVHDAIKATVPVISLSGGTEVNAAFVTANPFAPVWAGELQASALGMDMDVVDEAGMSLPAGKAGELVCKSPFPSQPLGFWGDDDGALYHGAYFDRFPGIWTHGDWCEWTEHGGMIIHGRSDSVLKPSGVRIGTAEIYRPLESISEVTDAVVVGFDHESEQRLVLFVVMAEGKQLDDDLEKHIRHTIREAETPRHVPWKIFQVEKVPRTRTGKVAEKAVRDVIHGRKPANVKSLENMEVLDVYADFSEQLRLPIG